MRAIGNRFCHPHLTYKDTEAPESSMCHTRIWLMTTLHVCVHRSSSQTQQGGESPRELFHGRISGSHPHSFWFCKSQVWSKNMHFYYVLRFCCCFSEGPTLGITDLQGSAVPLPFMHRFSKQCLLAAVWSCCHGSLGNQESIVLMLWAHLLIWAWEKEAEAVSICLNHFGEKAQWRSFRSVFWRQC